MAIKINLVLLSQEVGSVGIPDLLPLEARERSVLGRNHQGGEDTRILGRDGHSHQEQSLIETRIPGGELKELEAGHKVGLLLEVEHHKAKDLRQIATITKAKESPSTIVNTMIAPPQKII